MTLIEFHADVSRIANALEQLVSLVEKLVCEPPERDVKVQQATLDDLHTTSEEDIARMQAEQADFAERFRVVPGSEAFRRELIAYEVRMREIHGEGWEPPDWAAIMAQADREIGQSRVEADAAAQTADRL